MINSGEHVAIFGMTGSGKSTLTRKLSLLFNRRIIFDKMREWENPEIVVHDFQSFKKAYEERYLLPSFEIVIRPRGGLVGDALIDFCDDALQLIFKVESLNSLGIAVIFEEVWNYAPLHSAPPWFIETLLTGRHYNISVIGNSQRPASVSPVLRSQARHLFVGQYYEHREKKYYEETFGRDSQIITRPPEKFEFWWSRPNTVPVLIK